MGLLVALGHLGGLDSRGTYLYPCAPSKGRWCGLYQGFPEAALLRLVFCPCLLVSSTWPEGVRPAPSPPSPGGALPRDQRCLAVMVSSCSEWSEGLGRGFSGVARRHRQALRAGFAWRGQRYPRECHSEARWAVPLPCGPAWSPAQHRGHCCPFLGPLVWKEQSLQQSAWWLLALELRPCHIPQGLSRDSAKRLRFVPGVVYIDGTSPPGPWCSDGPADCWRCAHRKPSWGRFSGDSERVRQTALLLS